MTVFRIHKVRICPTEEQEVKLNKSVGVARFAYNWSLNRWNERYNDGLKTNARDIRNEFVKLKELDEFSWLKEVSKETYSNSILNMGTAWHNFFKYGKGKPKFKSKKHSKQSYTEVKIGTENLKWNQNYIQIPHFTRDNKLKTAEFPRFKGIIKSVTISKNAGLWFAAVLFELKEPPIDQYKRRNKKTNKVGIDLGVKTLAVLSDGHTFKKIDVKEIENKISKQQRKMSKMERYSKNYLKAKTKLQRLYLRKSNILNDNLHKVTNHIVRKYNHICLEDLASSNLIKNHKLARSIVNAQFYEFRRQIEYKIKYLKEKGVSVDLTYASRFFPSSKTCSNCGNIKRKLSLSERTYKCTKCGLKLDRDLNAAINLEQLIV